MDVDLLWETDLAAQPTLLDVVRRAYWTLVYRGGTRAARVGISSRIVSLEADAVSERRAVFHPP